MEEKEVYHDNGVPEYKAKRTPIRKVRQIKIFRSKDAEALMEAVNSFIADRDVINIHYTTPTFSGGYNACICDSVLVEYWVYKGAEK